MSVFWDILLIISVVIISIVLVIILNKSVLFSIIIEFMYFIMGVKVEISVILFGGSLGFVVIIKLNFKLVVIGLI